MPRNHSISATVDKAVLGLAESVASIVTCDCTDAEMGKALTETFRQCADFLKSNTRDSRGFSRDPANVDTAESNEDGGARERENENRFEDREEAALHEELERHVAALMAADPSLNRQEAMRHLLEQRVSV